MKKELHFKTQKLNLSLLLLVAVFIIISCTKKDANLQEATPVVSDITFRDGRLIFKDDSSFIKHQQWLFANQGNPQLIADKNKSFGFRSMTEYYLEGMQFEETDIKFTEYVSKYPSVFHKEIYDNSTLYLLPHSKILCYVANVDGIYQVGNQIYRIAQDYIYQTNDESKIEMLLLPKDQISSSDIKMFLSQPRLATKNDYGNKTVNFTTNTAFRIVSSLREYVYGNMWYDDIITNPQHSGFRAQLNTKSANGAGYTRPVNCPNCTPGTVTASSDEETGLSQDVIYVGNSQIDMTRSYAQAYSRGRLIVDGVPQYIYIKWFDALAYPASASWEFTSILSDPY